MARLFILTLALAAAAAQDNTYDGGTCTSEQTRCDDGACCVTGSWCCYEPKGGFESKISVNGRTCYQKKSPDQDCGSKDSDAAAPRAGIALLALGALAVAAA